MHQGHAAAARVLTRRSFLVASGIGLAGLSSAGRAAPAILPRQRPARSAILFFLDGGASHIDTWDMKPDAPVEFRGEFRPVATSAPGVQLCEHLPYLGRQAHHLAVIRSLGHHGRGTGDHHAGYYYNLTGREPDPTFRQLLNNRKPLSTDWPFMGSVVARKRPPHPFLPSLIALPMKPGFPEYTRPGQFAARLGSEYDPTYLLGRLDHPLEFTVPALTLDRDLDSRRLQSRRHLLHDIDEARRSYDMLSTSFDHQQERAFSLLASPRTRNAFDLGKEPQAVRDRYGSTLPAMTLLLARRLVEAEVPFVSVFWLEDPKLDKLCNSGGSWDTHGNNFNCLKDHLLPQFDRAFAALIGDLHDRGLLDSTLLIITSEMGRHPRVGDRRSGGVKGAGRDHWTNCMSTLLAGGGIRGGQVYGSSDKVAGYPADRPVAPEDIARTVYHALGIDDATLTDREGRPFSLTPEGRVLTELF
jgi:hypothetical protein